MKAVLISLIVLLPASGQNAASPKAVAPPDDTSTSLESLFQTKVITASRFADNLADAPGVMTVVTREEIDRFGGITLREILSRVAGIDTASNLFSDRSIVSVRGDQTKSTGSHVLFMINGRPTREVLEAGVTTELLEAFPVGILERIEVVEGPGSVLYGSNAYSGVINLITRKTAGKSVAVRGFGTGSGTSGGSAEAQYRKGDLSLALAAQFHRSTSWDTPIVPVLVGYLGSPINYSLYDNSRGLFAEASYKGFSAMVSSMEWRSPFEVTGSVGQNRWRRTFADTGYDFKPTSHWDMGFHATYTGTSLVSNAYPLVKVNGSEVELDWTNSIEINERTRVAFGTQYAYQTGVTGYISGAYQFDATDASRSSGGVYAQVERQLTDSLKLIGGFQANTVANVPTDVVPRAGLIWHASSHWFVRGFYGQAFRAPSLDEAYIQYPGLSGNLTLLPEKVTTYDFGVIYQANRLQASINYFRSRQLNTIDTIQVGLNIYQYENVGGLRFQGYQSEAKWYLRPRVLAQGSLLYQTNSDASGVPHNLPTPTLGAKAGFSFADQTGWTVGLFDVYSGLVPGFAGSNPKPSAHHLLTANLRLNLAKYFGQAAQRVAVFAHGENLTNRSVWQPIWGYNPITTLPVQRGRTIYYGLEFSLKRD